MKSGIVVFFYGILVAMTSLAARVQPNIVFILSDDSKPGQSLIPSFTCCMEQSC